MHKYLALTRRTTGEHPIFMGPMFLHGNNDFESFFDFSAQIASLLRKTTTKPVFGVDDEPAMHRSLAFAFPTSHFIFCSRHLKENLGDYMKVF